MILEQLFKDQQRLEGFWGPSKDGGTTGAYQLDLEDIPLRAKLKHIHAVDVDRMPWIDFIFRMIQISAATLETLSLGPSQGLNYILERYCFPPVSGSEILPENDEDTWAATYSHHYDISHSKSLMKVFSPNLPGSQEPLSRCLKHQRISLRVLHLIESGDEVQIKKILKSFKGLEELILEDDCEDVDSMALAISHHRNSLKRLYWHPVHTDGSDVDLTPNVKPSWIPGLKYLTELAIPDSFMKISLYFNGRKQFRSPSNYLETTLGRFAC
ncbi:hypothetical protein TWF128_003792 [Orbilia oligospora]|nr:hypothetical protein TWF128_003792 [Orbilia oligospora]